MCCSPETWVVITREYFPLPPHSINASHPNHHVHDFSSMLMHKTLNTAKNKNQ